MSRHTSLSLTEVSQLVVDSDGEVIVPTYDWASFFAPLFKKIKVRCMPRIIATLMRNSIKDGVQIKDEPQGLSSQRQWYLFDKIREFCPVADQDVTCPEPSSPRPTQSHQLPTVLPLRAIHLDALARSCTLGSGPS